MKSRNRERGVTIPMVALFLIVLFAMAALAVDLGVLNTARTSAQHAADAAALAGAYTFALNPAATQPTTATNAAIAVAAKTKVLGTSVTITAANVVVDTANRRVTVTVPRTGANGVQTFFAKAFGLNKVDVQTIAIAEASKTGNKSNCLKPIYIPNTVASKKSPTAACATGELMFNPTTKALTPFGTALLSASTIAPIGLTPAAPGDTQTPSQFYALDFGSGASTYRCALGQCLNDCGISADTVKCGDSFPVETGRMVGPTRQGVDDLIGNPADTWAGRYPNSTSEWTFHPGGNTSVYSDTSRSLAVAPVWSNCDASGKLIALKPGTSGQTVQIIGFIEIFVDGMQGTAMQGTAMQAHMMQPIACSVFGSGGGGGGGGTTGSGPLGIPVRLVNAAP